MRRLSKNRRGVSPVFSTVLLILITVIGMSVAFDYFVTYVRDYQQGRGSSVMELIVIEDVWFVNKTAMNITVYNLGKVSSRIATFYINDSLGNIISVDVSAGGHNQTVAQSPISLTGNTDYRITLVTDRGSSFVGHFVTPSW